MPTQLAIDQSLIGRAGKRPIKGRLEQNGSAKLSLRPTKRAIDQSLIGRVGKRPTCFLLGMTEQSPVRT